MTIGLSVLGATGKMGKKILSLAHGDPLLRVVAGVSRAPQVSTLGELIGEDGLQAPLLSDADAALSECDVAIDFTFHEATSANLAAALKFGTPLVIGTSGHSPEELKEIDEASKVIPIFFPPNFSFGVALCIEAVSKIGKALFGSAAIDVIETHHVHKKDSPSKTALALAAAVGSGKTVSERSSASPRQKDEIVIHAIRSGEVIGEHSVIFECGHERIELKHTAHSRDVFAQGALIGAKFLAKQPPGLYSLKDLFREG
ncbi:MAG: 4-hydroxy-tetrahydrodipicolinate reductase [Verrucomicrobia bacterium]|nr:4-hydroxy-tetrahydrodipicolinate reductase [Verrucomicrobiota bacterium]